MPVISNYTESVNRREKKWSYNKSAFFFYVLTQYLMTVETQKHTKYTYNVKLRCIYYTTKKMETIWSASVYWASCQLQFVHHNSVI